MTSDHPTTEDDLHGLLGYLLDSALRSDVQTYLDAHPEIAARMAAFSRQREALRAAYAPIGDEPIPPRLNVRHLMDRRRRSQHGHGVRWQRPCDCRWSAARAAGHCEAGRSSARKPVESPLSHRTPPIPSGCASR